MASRTFCAQCLRTLRFQSRSENLSPRTKQNLLRGETFSRSITTSARLLAAVPSSKSTASPTASAPPPTTTPRDFTNTNPTSLPKNQPPYPSIVGNAVKTVAQVAPSSTATYLAYGSSERMFLACAAQADYTIPQRTLTPPQPIPQDSSGQDLGTPLDPHVWWYSSASGGLGLTPTFGTWAQITFLHMYLLTVRLRGIEDAEVVRGYNQYLLDHFSHAAETRMITMHNIPSRQIRTRYLKDLFIQWRGSIAAYDEGLVKGDAVLAAAVWRNIFKGEQDEVDWSKVARVVGYMRRVIGDLGKVRDGVAVEAAVVKGAGKEGIFGEAASDADLVEKRSKGLDDPIVEETAPSP